MVRLLVILTQHRRVLRYSKVKIIIDYSVRKLLNKCEIITLRLTKQQPMHNLWYGFLQCFSDKPISKMKSFYWEVEVKWFCAPEQSCLNGLYC